MRTPAMYLSRCAFVSLSFRHFSTVVQSDTDRSSHGVALEKCLFGSRSRCERKSSSVGLVLLTRRKCCSPVGSTSGASQLGQSAGNGSAHPLSQQPATVHIPVLGP